MKKILLCLPFLILGMGDALSQEKSDVRANSEALLYAYLSQDSTKIYSSWHLDKGELLNLSDLLQLQHDVFGKPSFPKTYSYSETYNITEKYTSTILEMDDIFDQHPSATLRLRTFKGKKRKSILQIDDIRIQTKISNEFLDSLSAPYLELIAHNEIDSLVSLAFKAELFRKSLHQLEKNGSKKEIKNAKESHQMMESMMEMTRKPLASIDSLTKPHFQDATIKLKKGVPRLTLTFIYPEEKEKVCSFVFVRSENAYRLSSIGTAIRGGGFDDF